MKPRSRLRAWATTHHYRIAVSRIEHYFIKPAHGYQLLRWPALATVTDLAAKAREFCEDELKDHVVYKELAAIERNNGLKRMLEEFSEQELRHYEFWRRLAGDCGKGPSRAYIMLMKLSRRVLGLTFTLKLLELHERDVIEEYRRVLDKLDSETSRELRAIIDDELLHESNLIKGINEGIVKYMGFVALGLADAIVEITGVHAGFLGATATTLMAGIAGLIVGIAAAISMAGAAYIQSKHSGEMDPKRSAIVTGLSYLIAVILLAIPYFITEHQLTAFAVSVVIAVSLIAMFTFYGSVLNEASFKRDFLENISVLAGTAAAAYVIGDLLGTYFGIKGVWAT